MNRINFVIGKNIADYRLSSIIRYSLPKSQINQQTVSPLYCFRSNKINNKSNSFISLNYYSTSASINNKSKTTTSSKRINKPPSQSITITASYDQVNEFSYQIEQIVNQADLYYREHDYSRAIDLFSQALAQTKDKIESALLYSRIASARFKMGQRELASSNLSEALKLIPYRHQETYRMLALNAFMIEYEYDSIVDKNSQRARELLNLAVTRWDSVIDCDDSKPDGYVGKGRCLLKAERQEMNTCFHLRDRAMSCNYHHPPTQTYAAELLILQSKEKLALQLLNLFFNSYQEFYKSTRVYILDKNTLGNNYFRRGLCYLEQSKWEDALRDFTMSMNYLDKSEHPAIKFYRGRCYNRLKQYNKAIEDYSECIEFNPTHIDAYKERGEAYQFSGNFTMADRDKKVFQEDRQKRKEQRQQSMDMYMMERKEKQLKYLITKSNKSKKE